MYKFKKQELEELRNANLNRLVREYNMMDSYVSDADVFLNNLELFAMRCRALDNQLLNLDVQEENDEI